MTGSGGMHLGVIAVRLTRPFTGVGRFLECVLREWSAMDLPFAKVTLFAPRPIDPAGVVFPLDRFHVEVGGPAGPDPYWEARFLNPRAREIDVLFGPSYTLPVGYAGRSAVFYHGPSDNRSLTPEWWRSLAYDRLYRRSARRAHRVFVNSQVVKRRVVEVYGVPEERLAVVSGAPSDLFRPLEDDALLRAARDRYAGGRRFVLFVGKLSRRHAIPDLLRAYALLGEGAADRVLLVVGPDPLGLDVPRRARELGIGERVIYHPFVEHPRLPALYAAADLFVYPTSPAEGFGLPVLEAMACGAPVLSVEAGSIPEIASGAALLVPSSAPGDVAGGLRRLLADAELRTDLARRGLARARGYTWRATAERILEVLRDLAREPR